MPFTGIGSGIGGGTGDGTLDSTRIVRKSANYNASIGDHVVMSGGNVVNLPTPEPDALVMVSTSTNSVLPPEIQDPRSNKTIEGKDRVSPTVDHPIVLLSNGNNWYVSDPSNTSLAIPDSGVSRYEFEQDVTDSWGSNDGIDNSSAGYTTDAVVGEHAKSFSGDGFIDISSISIDYTTTFSISGWVKTSSQSDQALVGLGNEVNFRVNEDANNSGTWIMRFADGANPSLGGSTEVTDGIWHMWTATYDSGDLDLYLDGLSEASTTGFSLPNVDTENIGRRQDDFSYMNGDIDDVRFYDKKLTSTEVSNLYNTGSING